MHRGVSLNEDEARHQETEAKLLRANRALHVIGEANRLISRARAEAELLEGICAILTEAGGYRLAWIGRAEFDSGKSVMPIASSGFEEGYLEAAAISWGDGERGKGPCGAALRTGRSVICRNLLEDPAFAPWRADATARGYRSLISLPFEFADVSKGTLGIYAAEADAFDNEEVGLLEGVARDLERGLQALRDHRIALRTEETILDGAWERTFDALPLLVALIDSRHRILRTNAAMAETFGKKPADLVGAPCYELIHGLIFDFTK